MEVGEIMDQDEDMNINEVSEEESYSFPSFGVNNMGNFAKGVKEGFKSGMKENNNSKEEKPNPSKEGKPINNNNNGLTSTNNNNNNPDINKSPLNNKEKSPLNNKESSFLNNKEKPSSLNKTDENASFLNDKKDNKKENKLDEKNDDKKEDKDKKKDKDKKDDDKKDKKSSFSEKVPLKTKLSSFKAFIIKYKVPIILGLGILFLLLLLLFAFIMPTIIISETGITGDTVAEFVCEMGNITNDDVSVVTGYGWRVRTYGGSYWSKYKITATPLCSGDCTESCSNAKSYNETTEEEEEEICTIYAYEGLAYTENIYGEYVDENIYYYDLRSGEMKVASFNYGIYLNAKANDSVYALQPGKFLKEEDLGSKGIGIYTILDHSEAGEAKVKSIYGNLSSLPSSLSYNEWIINEEDSEDQNSRVVMEDVIGVSGNKNLYLEIQENDIGISLNRFFGYDDPIDICSNYNSSPSINEIEEKCGLPTYIGEEEGKNQICNEANYGIPSGEYTSLVCGNSSISATKPTNAQCAYGVYQYFESFLPSLDEEAWNKFLKVKGNAVDYWTNNNNLGSNGFKADKNPTAGSVWVSSYSSEKCGSKACGHVMVVEKASGETVTVFECNYDGKESCRTYDTTKAALASKEGFLGYIHILGDCTNENEEDD